MQRKEYKVSWSIAICFDVLNATSGADWVLSNGPVGQIGNRLSYEVTKLKVSSIQLAYVTSDAVTTPVPNTS